MSSPHQGQPVRSVGAPLESARAAVLLLHGRGATAESILGLADELGHTDVAYLAPQAAGFSWYPFRFLAPIEHNEPGFSSGLAAAEAVLEKAEQAGIPAERQMLMGFSQGACLTLELAARRPRRYGGVVAFTGGLLGPEDTQWHYPGSLARTPIFLGSSDPDPHVPWPRVEESARVLGDLGGEVALRRYPGMGHTIHPEEIGIARRMLGSITAEGRNRERAGNDDSLRSGSDKG